MTATLNPMTFPLHGARLIEASAGTGKTFTISGLYLRLLLGHGTEQTRHHRPLAPHQILVVTFTEAATGELKDRIRAKIHDARMAFAKGASSDPVIGPLIEQTADHQQAQEILLNAEQQMDEATIFTIHGFCRRMLVQNAFESGSRFASEFLTNDGQIKQQVFADYWRTHLNSPDKAFCQYVKNCLKSPAEMVKKFGSYLSGGQIEFSRPSEASPVELFAKMASELTEFKSQWLASSGEFEALIGQSGINKRVYNSKRLADWLNQVTDWAQASDTGLVLCDKLEKFAQSSLDSNTTKGTPVTHSVFVAIDKLLGKFSVGDNLFTPHIIKHCKQLLIREKQKNAWLSFDDLLTQLCSALKNDPSRQLAERIYQTFPVAMIDEFQDTDQIQYDIFSQIYQGRQDAGLFMIGDPKQAIYSFRGADIYTYIQAREQVDDIYTLPTNWRSAANMITAVNQIFMHNDDPFMQKEAIPFLPVGASPKGKDRYWSVDGERQAGVVYWFKDSDKLLSKSEYIEFFTQSCVSQIQTLLMKGQQNQALLHDGDKSQAIKQGDIAVLVRDGNEAMAIQKELSKKGIKSVYLSNKENVFTTQMAAELVLLLKATLAPENGRYLRSVHATRLFDCSVADIDALNSDELLWDNAIAELKQYQTIWFERGIMPMLRALMAKRQLAERLLNAEQGERNVTDVMHLSELLQHASQTLDTPYALLRWFEQSIAEVKQGKSSNDQQIQRLESEQDLVKIVTIHKSKGLEYHLVFLPFIFAFKKASQPKYYDKRLKKTVFDDSDSVAAYNQAEQERLAEDIRLLYVALTRSVYGCYIAGAKVAIRNTGKDDLGLQSAMAYLLSGGGQAPSVAMREQVNATAGEFIFSQQPAPEPRDDRFVLEEVAKKQLNAREFTALIDRKWKISSYSALSKLSHSSYSNSASNVAHAFVTEASMAQQLTELETLGLDLDALAEESVLSTQSGLDTSATDELSVFSFPRGAKAGTFLHALFEFIDFATSMTDEKNTQVIQSLMEKHQIDPKWLELLQAWLTQVLVTPLDGQALKLCELPRRQRLTEMEFLLPLGLTSAEQLTALLRQFDPIAARSAALNFAELEGMLKGFIDLIFEYQGKYYLLDWKSNHLGDQRMDYHQEALNQAMSEHRYDLQYLIYSLALHRYLGSRVKNYQYERDFGGVYYLFLRGLSPQMPLVSEAEPIDPDELTEGAKASMPLAQSLQPEMDACGVFYTKPAAALIEQLDKVFSHQPAESRR